MSGNDRFEPASYCVMAIGGSSFAGAMLHYFGPIATYMTGVILVCLIVRSLINEHNAQKDFDFRYLRIVAAFAAYFAILCDEQLAFLCGEEVRLLAIIFFCGIFLPLSELAVRYLRLYKVSGD